MTRSAIFGLALVLAARPAAAQTPDAEIVLENDSPYSVFVRATDNNSTSTPPVTSMRVRLDHGVGINIPVDLDGDGNYNVTWIATDPVDPPTKSQSGNCRGQRDAICYVDLSNAVPVPAEAPPPVP
jgi:hypothetical protein